MRWANMTAGEIIEALSKAPKDYKVYQDSGWECGETCLEGVVLDANTGYIVFVNNCTVKRYLELPERYKILGHGKEV
jgi:hypothetical protein